MNKKFVAAAFGGALFMVAAPQAAFAQAGQTMMGAPNGAELHGQSVRVEMADGTVNTVDFGADGTVRITSGSGSQVVNGRWFVQNQMMCLELGGTARECWPYQAAFQANQPLALTSDCGSASRWTALGTNQMMPPPPIDRRAGERG